MSKNDDKIKQASDYIGFMLNENVRIVPADKQLTDSIPLSAAQYYTLYKSRLLGQDVVLAFAKDDDTQTPAQTKKTMTLLESKCNCLVILIAQKMASYNVNRLIAHRVDFIIPQRQIFVPSMLVALKKAKSSNASPKEKMPPLAQCIVLYHIQAASLNGEKAKDIERIFNVSYATVNRALRRLKQDGLITLEGKKTKSIKFSRTNEELWEAALPYLSTPIEKIVYTDSNIDRAKEAGINALSEYTMINREDTLCQALSKEELKAANIATDDQYGKNRIEIWRYSPQFLSNEHIVDKLSLYLSLKDSADERVQIELENLIQGMKW